MPITLVDTAGLRETDDEVEKIGVSLAKKAADDADLIIIAIDGSKPLTSDEAELFAYTSTHDCITVICKSDLDTYITAQDIKNHFNMDAFSVSSKTGEGIEKVKEIIALKITPDTESPIITNMRHIESLQLSLKALESAVCGLETLDAECLATDIRYALTHLGAITGREVDDEVIDRIFSRFCVGK